MINRCARNNARCLGAVFASDYRPIKPMREIERYSVLLPVRSAAGRTKTLLGGKIGCADIGTLALGI